MVSTSGSPGGETGIAPAYRHRGKVVHPAEPLECGESLLKWYGLGAEELPVPEEIARRARVFLSGTTLEAHGMGFVILHRCGSAFYFLIVCTWRNNNEIWETVFYKDGDGMPDFALFPREGTHKPTFCVWEMVPVWHEQQAWIRFLESPRDAAAVAEWLGDRCAGPA